MMRFSLHMRVVDLAAVSITLAIAFALPLESAPAQPATKAGQSPASAAGTSSAVTPPGAAPAVTTDTATLCGALEAAARVDDLPLDFFVRLIWRESRFDPAARSPAGAQGVAQFMPSTAGERGLADPFEPTRALKESAGYLRDLHARFGNWGLAAAAYNAGPGRVGRWLAAGGTTALPSETVGYVHAVTGHTVEEWRTAKPPTLELRPGFSCLAFAGEAGRRGVPPMSAPNSIAPDPNASARKLWSVILVGALSRDAVLRQYAIVRASHDAVLGPLTPVIVKRRIGGEAIMRFVAQIEQDDRVSSNKLCKRLQSSGGSCIVLRNSGR